SSDLVTPCVLEIFGDILQIHHYFSSQALSKDRFEYALDQAFRRCGTQSQLADRCNPGHDITVNGIPISLKTQADRFIKRDTLHISRFMELGKGRWQSESDLEGLRNRYFSHMESYERIFQLRRLVSTDNY